jgi:hypothetical protein
MTAPFLSTVCCKMRHFPSRHKGFASEALTCHGTLRKIDLSMTFDTILNPLPIALHFQLRFGNLDIGPWSNRETEPIHVGPTQNQS